MLNMTASLIGSLELAVMECFWKQGPQTSGQILATLRQTRTIADTTVTTTLANLHTQGLLTRQLHTGRKRPWVYTARYPTRGALLAGTFERLAVQIEADPLDRAEALGKLLGMVR